ncbi:MAG: beta-galactosidase, partial [Verrucomicrobiae bacterium]|nr:beta-galactosidase [Verrucomicrobiae bacterium]
AGMVFGDADPRPWVEAGFPYYVENIVNRGLCLKWNSRVRDWSAFVDQWKKTRDRAALVREYCLDDPAWRKWACDQMRSVVRKNAPHKPLFYNIRDELSVTISANPFDYDFSPVTLASFRRWLKSQYGDIDALNRQWETSFATWDTVMPFTTDEIKARQRSGNHNFAPWCDFRTYMDISLASALEEIRRAAHEVDPTARVGIEGTQMPHAFGGYDLWRLSQVLDWVEPYDIAGARAIWGSFMRGKPILSTIGEADPQKACRRLWHLLLEGDVGCIVWWSEDCLDWKSPELTLTPKGKALASVFAELRSPVARLFVRAEREFDPIVIHYSQPSIQVNWLLESERDGASWVRRFSSYEARHNQMAKARVRCLEQLRAAGFSPRFGLVPLPGETFLMIGSLAMSEREVAAARAARSFADTTPAVYDEHGTKRTTPAETGAKLVNDWHEAVAHLQPEVLVTPPLAVYRYRVGKARLLAFEPVRWQQMDEDLKVCGEAGGQPLRAEARLKTAAEVYDLRTGRCLGFRDRFEFVLEPPRPALFALLPCGNEKPLSLGELLRSLPTSR